MTASRGMPLHGGSGARACWSTAAAVVLATGALGAPVGATDGWVVDPVTGIQHREGLVLEDAYVDDGFFSHDHEAAPDGSLVAIRRSEPDLVEDIVRLRRFPAGTGLGAPVTVIAASDLADPGLWDAGVDGDVRFGTSGSTSGRGALSVAPGGDLIVGLVRDRSSILVSIDPDGGAQRIVTMDELTDAGQIPPMAWGGLMAIAGRDDLLWLQVNGSTAEQPDGMGTWMFEVRDPNADDDWSDRAITPVLLPDGLPALAYGAYDWQVGAFTRVGAERTSERASILLPYAAQNGEYRIVRLVDTALDGDLRDPGEAETIFRGTWDAPGMMMPRLVTRMGIAPDGTPREEIVAAGIGRTGRVSVIADGIATDVVRGLGPVGPDAVAATPDGVMYIVTQAESIYPPRQTIHALRALAPGETEPSLMPVTGPVTPPTLVEPGALAEDTAALALWLGGMTADGTSDTDLVAFGADGSGPALLTQSARPEMLCLSADRSAMVYSADDEVRGEPFLYLQRVDGGPRKLSEERRGLMCGFGGTAMLTFQEQGGAWVVRRLDLATGAETVVDEAVRPGGLVGTSSDGRFAALSAGADGERLLLVDLDTGDVRTIATVEAAAFHQLATAPDGRLAWVVGPWDPMNPQTTGTFDVVVAAADGSGPRTLRTVTGLAPEITWSPDGTSLLVREQVSSNDGCCEPRGALSLLTVADGSVTPIAEDVSFAAWSPADPGVLAWVTPDAITVQGPDGGLTTFAPPPDPLCDTCQPRETPHWGGFADLGWSPDGRYLAASYFGSTDWGGTTGVVDMTTGTYRVLWADSEAGAVYSAAWVR